ncbi:hypothetical protein CPB84DRAFT_1768329 [Gymnopilus junonius]|uniref:Uncharacterized protein n=1 Tax=Gymnopilus junonius TaxID=109634 RepID=A0A9P5NX50_GYMJU|nr:hypothetical protein CPB84DRAFT_1768329 [Gymnopilus junonius]
MASDSSDSPILLTPESTGFSHGLTIDTGFPDSPTSSSSGTTGKKARRQTAFYPHVNSSNKLQKPFSRSAAKRESVMALGSIEHLQHYFTKTGLSAKNNPLDKPHHGLVRAIGGMGHIPTSPSLSDIQDFQMPPSPAVPNNPPNPILSPHVKAYEVDPESLLPGVIEDVITVAHVWKLDRYGDTTTNLDIPFDVLDVLKTTTRAIRSTRNYLLSLPDESAGTIRAHKHLSASTSSSSTSSQQVQQTDPLILIRRSALEVLTVLRQLEENCRLPLSDDAYDAQSDGGHSRGAGTASSPSNGTLDLPPAASHEAEPSNGSYPDPDASITFSLVQVNGRYQNVPVWEDEEDVFARRERWDERLVLGSGWLYKQDVKLGDLLKERDVVSSYLDIVDEVLFDGKRVPGQERGWDKVRRKREGRAVSRAAKNINRRVSAGEVLEGRSLSSVLEGADSGRRRVSTGMEMDDIREEEDEEVRSTFVNDRQGRVHALLHFFLPSHLQPALGASSSRSEFLSSLSSGQLLCIAYNACVRKSKKPWGFVSKDSVHDILALEKAAAAQNADEEKEGGKKLWTFRRTDNLRLWAGALKLRYMLPIQLPSHLHAPPIPSLPSLPSSALSKKPSLTTMATSASLSVSVTGTAYGTPTGTPLASPSPSQSRFGSRASREPPIVFDARVVAKKEEGWEDMLEAVLYRWVDKAVDERRVAT